LTPYWGESLEKGEGDYKMTFTADVYPEYNLNNLYIVAYLNRGVDNGALHQQVVNSGSVDVAAPEAVNSISNDSNAVVYVENGVAYINGSADVEVFNLSGVRVANNNLSNGVYIVRADEVVAKVSVR
jgi:hypothetical protein